MTELTALEPVNVTSGKLTVRLAKNQDEIEAAQKLRYRVFIEEMGANPTPDVKEQRRDFDSFDPFCDHLIVISEEIENGNPEVIATYRLMRRDAAKARGRFYSIDEYDIAPIVNFPGEILELGRSCVDIRHRTKPVMQLLWKGIADYVAFYKIGIMFGCASFPGTNPFIHATALTYLYRNHLAPMEIRPKALPERYFHMDVLKGQEIDAKRSLAALPPLIKGYLRLGGFVGDGAVIDHEFGTVDVSILVVTDLVTSKYAKHYTR